jgi:hypothetical protein
MCPDHSTAVPTEEPQLTWALEGDGRASPKVVERRDLEFKCVTDKSRAARVK